MGNNDERARLVLGALLHDIGKFKQRAALPEDSGKSHCEIGFEWLKSIYGDGPVARAAYDHHGMNSGGWESNLATIIYEADNLAAGKHFSGRGACEKETVKWHQTVPLKNVFSLVRDVRQADGLNKADLPYSKAAYCALEELGGWPGLTADGASYNAAAYLGLWEKFEKEFKILVKAEYFNIETLLHLLMKYTSTIPSISLKGFAGADEAAYRKCFDVSLFDHLKTTAAAAACLYDYHREKIGDGWESGIFEDEIFGEKSWTDPDHEPFLLIGGDISGVQDFIYTISSKGALRSLKGRSFFLELFTEHVVNRLLEDLSLTRCNLIFTGGGHFYIIAPNTEITLETVRKVREEAGDFLFEVFNAGLEQFIETAAFGKTGFGNVSGAWSRLAARLEAAKKRRWESRLEDCLGEPTEPHEDCYIQNCAVCGRDDKALVSLLPSSDEVTACEGCKDQYSLGLLLMNCVKAGSRPAVLEFDRQEFDAIRIGNRYYLPVDMAQPANDSKAAKALAVHHMNDWDLGHYRYRKSRPMLAGLYIHDEHRDLESMASKGVGMSRLGLARMDVDHLGAIFQYGVAEENRTMAQMACLSQNLTLFFKYHLDGILERRPGYPTTTDVLNGGRKRLLMVVYAGGDDVFLVGNWADVTEVAYDVRNAFCLFAQNPFVTLSSGIALGYDHSPIYQLAQAAGKSEHTAKGAGRNSVTLFDVHTFNWTEGLRVVDSVKDLLSFFDTDGSTLSLPQGSLSKTGLNAMLILVRGRRREKKWILPRLAYFFGRFNPKNDRFDDPWMKLKNSIVENSVYKTDKDWERLETALLWILMLMRKEAGDAGRD